MWRVGLGLVFFGSLADFAALSFGPQSLVAPLGSLTLVSNVIFAPLLLKETIGHWDVLATVLIVLGSSVAVIFGSHEAVTYTSVRKRTIGLQIVAVASLLPRSPSVALCCVRLSQCVAAIRFFHSLGFHSIRSRDVDLWWSAVLGDPKD